MDVISKDDAIKLGLKHYFTGNECKHGHIARRLVSDRSCMECNKEKRQRLYDADPEKFRERRRNAYALNPEKERATAKIRSAEWRVKNPNHEGMKLSKRKYKKSVKGMATDSKSRVTRRLKLKQATPIWADMNEIGDIYMEAAYMQLQVDHIIPLKNKNVCGLHVAGNLQLLNALDNNRKNNRFNSESIA